MQKIAFALIIAASLIGCSQISKWTGTDLEGRLETYVEDTEVVQEAMDNLDEARGN